MITIKRISGNMLGMSQYQITMNDQILVTTFDHNRPDDLPTLLHKAAEAVTLARSNHGNDVYKRSHHDT